MKPFSAVQLYSPKSTLEFIVKFTVLSVALTELKLVPSGLYQVSVGIGTASDLQVNVTVCPIQDIGEEEVRPCMTAGSVNYHRKICYYYHIVKPFLPPMSGLDFVRNTNSFFIYLFILTCK